MFMLLYPVCDSVNVTSSFFFCVWMSFTCNNSFMYLLHVIILDTRASKGDNTNCLLDIPSEEKTKTEISGCGSFVFAYFQLASFIIPSTVYTCKKSCLYEHSCCSQIGLQVPSFSPKPFLHSILPLLRPLLLRMTCELVLKCCHLI